MGWRYLKVLGVLLALFAVSPFLSGCGGKTSEATAVPVPIEIPAPAILKFVSVQGLKVDVQSLIVGPLKAMEVGKTIILDPKTLTAEDMQENISFGPYFYGQFIDNFFVYAINGIHELEIPENEKNTACQMKSHGFSSATGYLRGTHDVALDFAPFHYSNDASSTAGLNCSGNTKVFPVCVRMWLGGGQFIAGIFVEPPVYSTSGSVPDAIGEGNFKVIVPDIDGLVFETSYNYKQPGTEKLKDVGYFFNIDQSPFFGSATDTSVVFGFDAWAGHAALHQDGPDATAFKIIGVNTQLQNMQGIFNFGDISLNYLGQFVQGVDLWGGALDLMADIIEQQYGPGEDALMPSTCAVPSTGEVLDSTISGPCAQVGDNKVNILVGDPPPFISTTEVVDYQFPKDFPASPPKGLPDCESFRTATK